MNGYEAFDTKAVEVRLQGHDVAWPTEELRPASTVKSE
jgi:hypothetical protein